MSLARAQTWRAAALAAGALVSCRFGYEALELPLRGDGGGASAGGDESSRNRDSGGRGAESGTVDGGAGAHEGGFGATAVGGMVAGGTTAGEGGHGNSGEGAAGAGGEPSFCVSDASCSCETLAGHGYRFCAVSATRDAGLAACQSSNMVMIRIDSAEENAWLLQRFTDHGMFIGAGSPIVLLGGNALEVAGMWRWDDGTLFWDGAPVDDLYTNWAAPPKAGQSDCLGMTSDGKWVSRACNSGNATVACESP